jgi:TP901-1 family phage major tail protein
MTAQRGKDLLLKIGSANGFATVAGLRAKRLQFNCETVNITDSQSSGQWRELLSGSAIRRASIGGDGIFKDADSDELVRSAFFSGEIPQWLIIIPDFGQLAGPFQITSLEYAGQHSGEITFRINLESAGELEFSAS